MNGYANSFIQLLEFGSFSVKWILPKWTEESES